VFCSRTFKPHPRAIEWATPRGAGSIADGTLDEALETAFGRRTR